MANLHGLHAVPSTLLTAFGGLNPSLVGRLDGCRCEAFVLAVFLAAGRPGNWEALLVGLTPQRFGFTAARQ